MKKKRERKLARQVERAHQLALNKAHKDNVMFFHSRVTAQELMGSLPFDAPYEGTLVEGELGAIDCGINIITEKGNTNG